MKNPKKNAKGTKDLIISQPNNTEENGSPAQLLKIAIENKADVNQLKELMDLQDRWLAQKAKKNFLTAIKDFQLDCPVMKKTKKVKFTSQRTQTTTDYNYAPLSGIDEQIKPLLHKHGLSKRWEFTDKGELIECSCIISHVDGHAEKTVMTAAKDDSGGKNVIQQRGSTMTYLQRYTLIGALGISTGDDDVDGLQPPKPEPTDDEETKELKELVALKKDALTPAELKRANEIIRTKEKNSYKKLRETLATK